MDDRAPAKRVFFWYHEGHEKETAKEQSGARIVSWNIAKGRQQLWMRIGR